MRRYIALLEPHNGEFGVVFPDFPGCTSHGATYQQALANAAEALIGHVGLMQADSDAIPEPRSLDAIRTAAAQGDWDDPAGAIVAMIPLIPDDGAHPVRIDVALGPRLLAAIDEQATRIGMTRSAFLADAARRRLLEP